MVVRVVGGAENMIKCEGWVLEPKYSIKEPSVSLNEVFISMPSQCKLTLRNLTKQETPLQL
jgi:hypothetical protein